MSSAIDKFENPSRLKELSPADTLKDIGLSQGDSFFDYGAGTGIFTEAAAAITSKQVYAYDIDPSMLELIQSKKEKKKLSQVILLDTPDKFHTIAEHSIDHLLMATVFHHIADMDMLFKHFDFLMKERGTVTIIEFHCRETPMGPPPGHRIPKDTVEKEFSTRNFSMKMEKNLGENFYVISFQKKK